ncbi:MAG: zinc-dependent alcohol dehydrogenase family protein [Bacillota bacterium]|nr:zinc-dependent alcohol dehydrogenase family protein [Bacillota bacterium]MDI7249050.1 zinc-dependent alcohol dehydrogenase family protein [Bacillota bacterium]
MHAMVLHSPRPAEENPLSLQEVPSPVPGPGQVRLRVKVCGVCHTDLHTVEGELPLRHLPLIPGHQVVGTIDRIGPAASSPGRGSPCGGRPWRIGDRVGVPWLHQTCGECEHCRRGEENLCERALFTGLDVDGGYAEYMVAPAGFVVPIPDVFSDTEAAPLLCAGIIGYRSLRVAGVLPGETLALFGFGASAHLAIQVARYWGCRVYVFTRSREHQQLARALGAAWAGAAGEQAPSPAERAITFAPAGDLIPVALAALRRGGTLAINAVHLDRIPAFDYGLLYWERTVRSVANSTRQDALEFMDIAARIPIRVTTRAYPLEDANRALYDLKRRAISGAAVLLPGAKAPDQTRSGGLKPENVVH